MGLALLILSCSGEATRSDPAADPGEPVSGPVTGAVQVSLAASSASPRAGSHVSVAVQAVPSDGETVAALQVALVYDATALRFLGAAVPTERSGPVLTHEPAPGRVIVALVAPHGVSQEGAVLVFEVHRPDALHTMRLLSAGAVAAVLPLERRLVRVMGSEIALDPSLPVKLATPSAAGWQAALGWGASSPTAPRVSAGAIYGDVDVSGGISLNDVLLVLNVSVGARPPLTGDALEVANVVPANTADGREATLPDVCRPGRDCTPDTPFSEVGPGVVDLLDALAIAEVSVGESRPVVGRPVPEPPPPGPTARLSRLLKSSPYSSALGVNDEGVAVGIVNRYYVDLLADPLLTRARAMSWSTTGNVAILERPVDLPPGQVEPPSGLNPGTAALGINNSGLSVSHYASPQLSFMTLATMATFLSPDVYVRSAFNDMGTAPSRVINDANETLAGCRPPGGTARNRACVVDVRPGATRLLPAMPNRIGAQSDATLGINQRGDVVGRYFLQEGGRESMRGIVWPRWGAVQALLPLPGDNCSQGDGINAAGDIVGVSGICLVEAQDFGQPEGYFYSTRGFSSARPVIWKRSDNYVPHALAAVAGLSTSSLGATAINDHGVIIGGFVGGLVVGFQPVFWTPDGVGYTLDALGALQSCVPATFGSFAFAINERDQVAGECAGHAAVWDITIPAAFTSNSIAAQSGATSK